MNILKSTEILYIDAISIYHKGGGATHLIEILNNIEINNFKFNIIHVFGSDLLLERLPNKKYIIKRRSIFFNKNIIFRYFYIFFVFPFIYLKDKPKIVFSLASNIHILGKLITINQSLLPFEFSKNSYKITDLFYFSIIKKINLLSFKKSVGVIFMTNYAFDLLSKLQKSLKYKSIIIPHGLSSKINNFQPKNNYIISDAVKILYVSSLNEYKNHMEVYLAVKSLTKKGFRISLEFIGDASYFGKSIINKIYYDNIPNLEFIYHDHMNQLDLYLRYQNADIFVFASTAESFGLNSLEAMYFSLPIASSNLSSIPETIKDGCIYFNPNDIKSIEKAILDLIQDQNLRVNLSKLARNYSLNYNWIKCSNETFNFINRYY